MESRQEEEAMFLERLETVGVRRREMERRYRLISRLHPNRLHSFLDWERETAAKRIQAWWRDSRPAPTDSKKEVLLFITPKS